MLLLAGYCTGRSDIKVVCSQIRVETPLYTLIRGPHDLLFVFYLFTYFLAHQQNRVRVDPDGCEWVNVSSGTGLPGLSRIKGR